MHETAGQPLFPSNCFRFPVGGEDINCVRRFLYDDFNESYVPTIEDFHRKIYKIHNEVYQLDILDTSGIHRFRQCDVFSSSREALRLREQIIESIQSAPGSNKKDKHQTKNQGVPIPMIIVGNKCDKTAADAASAGSQQQQAVPATEVEHILQRFKDRVAFIECSSRENVNIVELFETLFILADLPDEMIPNAGRRISLTHGGNQIQLNNGRGGSAYRASAASSDPTRMRSNMNASAFTRFHAELQRMLHLKRSTGRRSGIGGTVVSHPSRHGITLRRRLSDAYSALITNVRRPSIKADLIMVQEKREHGHGHHASSAHGTLRAKCRNKKRPRNRQAAASGGGRGGGGGLEREMSSATVDSDEEQAHHRWREKFCCA
ncbi:putative Dexamethasone-induced Ras-related protein 1 [Hypsibius exemplaris]|uniref:Dexamethasone-induced Ras-related protein 1 n=1 Tax=Hypsibius exemplaris TaxID=2072580 RepID=A0A1W0W8F4_HYPEX|nr:putative Dexamethasone-induced Ras-related protein 1 [Hypsibius exemplaris]